MALITRARPINWSVGIPPVRLRSPGFSTSLAIAVAAGVALIIGTTPVIGRGDLGQWLMTSRYYLGQTVPDYRDIAALPPLVPFALSALRLAVPDPVFAINLFTALLAALVAAVFFALGRAILGSSLGGLLSLTTLMLMSDRVLELFAFGGLFQAAALLFMGLSLTSFVIAGRRPAGRRKWWLLGTLAAGLTIVTHVGTALSALPVFIVVAALAAYRPARPVRERVRAVAVPVVLLGLGAALSAVLILLPASHEYVANPASLGYRGPERFLAGLFAYWPNAAIIFFGAACIALGAVNDVRRRKVGPYSLLAGWALVAWGSLAYSVFVGVATDYPRFATVILPPLGVGAAGGILWLVRALASSFSRAAQNTHTYRWLAGASVAIVVLAIPFAVGRFDRLAAFYQPADAGGLNAAVSWLDSHLAGQTGTVLTPVREGKWLEGVTGRAALFSQPVRFAFRQDEWQRSLDADTLYRSTLSMSSDYYFVKYTAAIGSGSNASPTGPIVSINHGGEYLDLLRMAPADTTVDDGDGQIAINSMSAVGSVRVLTADDAKVTARFSGRSGATAVSLAQSVELLRLGATMHISDAANVGNIGTIMHWLAGPATTITQVGDREAEVCFKPVGLESPCVRIWVAQPDAQLTLATDGLTINTTSSSTLDVYVTVLSHASPWAPLAILDPVQLLAQHDVAGALLLSADPASASRTRRLQALGLTETQTFGLYTVLVRP